MPAETQKHKERSTYSKNNSLHINIPPDILPKASKIQSQPSSQRQIFKQNEPQEPIPHYINTSYHSPGNIRLKHNHMETQKNDDHISRTSSSKLSSKVSQENLMQIIDELRNECKFLKNQLTMCEEAKDLYMQENDLLCSYFSRIGLDFEDVKEEEIELIGDFLRKYREDKTNEQNDERAGQANQTGNKNIDRVRFKTQTGEQVIDELQSPVLVQFASQDDQSPIFKRKKNRNSSSQTLTLGLKNSQSEQIFEYSPTQSKEQLQSEFQDQESKSQGMEGKHRKLTKQRSQQNHQQGLELVNNNDDDNSTHLHQTLSEIEEKFRFLETNYKEENQQLIDENESLYKNNEMLQDSIIRLREDVLDLESILKGKIEIIREKEKQISDLNVEIDRMKRLSYEQQEEERNRLQGLDDEGKVKGELEQKLIGMLKGQVKHFEEKVEGLEKEIAKHVQEKQTLQRVIENSEKEQKESVEYIKVEISEKMEIFEQKVIQEETRLQRQLEILREDNDQKQIEISNLKNQISLKQQQIQKHSETLEITLKQLEFLKQANIVLKASLQKKEKQLTEITVRLNEQKQVLEGLNKDKDEKLSKTVLQLEDCESHLLKAEKEIERLLGMVRQKQKERVILGEENLKISLMSQEIERLNEKEKAQLKQIDDKKEIILGLEAKLKEVDDEMIRLKRNNQKQSQDSKYMYEGVKSQLQKRVNFLQTKVTSLSEELGFANSEKVAQSQKISCLGDQLSSYEKQLSELKKASQKILTLKSCSVNQYILPQHLINDNLQQQYIKSLEREHANTLQCYETVCRQLESLKFQLQKNYQMQEIQKQEIRNQYSIIMGEQLSEFKEKQQKSKREMKYTLKEYSKLLDEKKLKISQLSAKVIQLETQCQQLENENKLLKAKMDQIIRSEEIAEEIYSEKERQLLVELNQWRQKGVEMDREMQRKLEALDYAAVKDGQKEKQVLEEELESLREKLQQQSKSKKKVNSRQLKINSLMVNIKEEGLQKIHKGLSLYDDFQESELNNELSKRSSRMMIKSPTNAHTVKSPKCVTMVQQQQQKQKQLQRQYIPISIKKSQQQEVHQKAKKGEQLNAQMMPAKRPNRQFVKPRNDQMIEESFSRDYQTVLELEEQQIFLTIRENVSPVKMFDSSETLKSSILDKEIGLGDPGQLKVEQPQKKIQNPIVNQKVTKCDSRVEKREILKGSSSNSNLGHNNNQSSLKKVGSSSNGVRQLKLNGVSKHNSRSSLQHEMPKSSNLKPKISNEKYSAVKPILGFGINPKVNETLDQKIRRIKQENQELRNLA